MTDRFGPFADKERCRIEQGWWRKVQELPDEIQEVRKSDNGSFMELSQVGPQGPQVFSVAPCRRGVD